MERKGLTAFSNSHSGYHKEDGLQGAKGEGKGFGIHLDGKLTGLEIEWGSDWRWEGEKDVQDHSQVTQVAPLGEQR